MVKPGLVILVCLLLVLPVPWLAAVGISRQPASQHVEPGTNVTFSVAVTNNTPASYQWFFEGTNLPGANAATLVVTNVQGPQSGFYKVLVRSCTSVVMSDVAVLTVAGTSSITFANDSRARVYTSNGQLAGSGNRAQLYAGLDPQNLWPVGPPVTINSGLFNGGLRGIPVAPSGIIFIQVVAWQGTAGSIEECYLSTQCQSARTPVLRMRTWSGNFTDIRPNVVSAGLFDFAITPLTPPSYFGNVQGSHNPNPPAGTNAGFAYTYSYFVPPPHYPLTFRWYKDGLPIPGGPSGQSYTIQSVQPEHAGTYNAIGWHLYQREWFPDLKMSVSTNPVFRFQRLSRNPANGVVEAKLGGQIGCPCAIEYSHNLRQWFPLTNGTFASDQFTVIDPNASISPQRFYRARSDL